MKIGLIVHSVTGNTLSVAKNFRKGWEQKEMKQFLKK